METAAIGRRKEPVAGNLPWLPSHENSDNSFGRDCVIAREGKGSSPGRRKRGNKVGALQQPDEEGKATGFCSSLGYGRCSCSTRKRRLMKAVTAGELAGSAADFRRSSQGRQRRGARVCCELFLKKEQKAGIKIPIVMQLSPFFSFKPLLNKP